MPITFAPHFTITPKTAHALMRIEAIRQTFLTLPVTPLVLRHLRETARLYTTHYSTQIEGNRLTPDEVREVVHKDTHFPGRERDENEVKGYYAALEALEARVARQSPLSVTWIQTLHALVMSQGRVAVKPTPYRDGQNVITDSISGAIVYMSPEAHDVPGLMQGLVQWINRQTDLPCPIIAGIAHYQFATIHPYYDGNGRTARLLATFILHRGGYDLKGIYSLEEYYAQHLQAYYNALSMGPSHNYYLGRADADITPWVDYFCDGMATACEAVHQRAMAAAQSGETDQSQHLKTLDPRQRKALELFQLQAVVTSKDIGALFGFKPRTCSALCRKWVEMGFLDVVNDSRKSRCYTLARHYSKLQ